MLIVARDNGKSIAARTVLRHFCVITGQMVASRPPARQHFRHSVRKISLVSNNLVAKPLYNAPAPIAGMAPALVTLTVFMLIRVFCPLTKEHLYDRIT
jgi:hypothetical protein